MKFNETVSDLIESIDDPEKKLEILLNKAYELRRTDIPFLQECSEYCIRESQKIGFKRGIALGLSCQGMGHYITGEPQKALMSLDQAVALCLGNNNMGTITFAWSLPLVRSYNLMGVIALDQGNLERALALFDNAYKLANRLGHADQMSHIRGNLANVYSDLGQYVEAEKILREELDDSQKQLDIIAKSALLANLGRVLNLSDQLEEADVILRKALKLTYEPNLPSIRAGIVDELGTLEVKKRNFSLAERYFRECISLNEDQDLAAYLGANVSLVNLLLQMEKFEDAEKLLQKIIPIGEKEEIRSTLAQIYMSQSQLFEKTNRPEDALSALKRFVDLTTSVDGQGVIDKATQQELERLREFRNSLDTVWLVGSQIASVSNAENAILEMMKDIFEITEADIVEIALKNDAGIEYLSSYSGKPGLRSSFRPVNEFQKLAALCVRNNQEITIQDLEHEIHQYVDVVDPIKLKAVPETPQTLFFFPLNIGSIPVGALSLQYKLKNSVAFDRRIAYRLLAQFLTVGLTNMHRLKEISREKDILAEAASYDVLTGLLNRRSLEERTIASYRNAVRHKFDCHIVLIDIDHFKSINDTWGHLTGDQAIKLVSNHLKNIFKRATDYIGRFGGDEFVIMITDTPRDRVLGLAETLRKEIEVNSYPAEKGDVRLTVSIGISGRNFGDIFPSDINILIDEADKALYQSKQKGRNRLVFFDR